MVPSRFLQIGNSMSATGETFHFLVTEVVFDAEFIAQDLKKISLQSLSNEPGQMEPGASLSGLTAIIANDPFADGHIRLWEASRITFTRGYQAFASDH
jgi:hypothetical protein